MNEMYGEGILPLHIFILGGIHMLKGNTTNLIKYFYKNENNEEGRHVLLYSGGCDSTLILYDLCEAFKGSVIYTISMNFPWLHEIKYKTEEEYRLKFLKFLKSQGHTIIPLEINVYHKYYPEFDEEIDKFLFTVQEGTQAVAWITNACTFLENRDKLYFGLTAHDSHATSLPYLQNVIDQMALATHRSFTLRTPLDRIDKHYIISRLFDKEIYQYAWFCETPNEVGKPCLNCQPCIRHITALIAMSRFDEFSRYKDLALRELDKLGM